MQGGPRRVPRADRRVPRGGAREVRQAMTLPDLPFDVRAVAKELCDVGVDLVAGAITRKEFAQRLLRIAELAAVEGPIDDAERRKLG